ncbi:hypothetical protein HY419_01895 [candidate division WWE3 bacterium]|nr:hypothetical protein [candidate division WWE3 bacterium]
MLLTPHTFVGITIASSVPNPFISVPVSFIMHFLGDKVPHWDFFSNSSKENRLKGWRVMALLADFGLASAVGVAFTLYALWVKNNSNLALNIFLCAIASNLPDALESPHIFFGKNDRFSKALLKIQHDMQFQAPLPWGIISQVVVVASCLILLSGSLLQA